MYDYVYTFFCMNMYIHFLKWLSYNKTSILDTTLKLKFPKINYYLQEKIIVKIHPIQFNIFKEQELF